MSDDRIEELTARALRVLSGQVKPKPTKEETEAKKLLDELTPQGAPTKMVLLEERKLINQKATTGDRQRRRRTDRKLVNRSVAEEIHELRVNGSNWKHILAVLREKHPELRNIPQIQDIYFNYLDISRHARRENIDEMREIQHERLEQAWSGLSPKIDMGRERAVEVGMKVLERQARLWGLDASDAIQNKQTQQEINIMIQAHPGDARARDLLIEHQPLQLEEHKE